MEEGEIPSYIIYTLSEDFGRKWLNKLKIISSKDPINFVFSQYSFSHVYSMCCKKLAVEKPTTAQYLELMSSPEPEQIAQLTLWILLFDMIPQSFLKNDTMLLQEKIFDRLSIYFYDLKEKLKSISVSAEERFIEFWSSAVCATYFTLLAAEFPTSEFINNPSFAFFVENQVRVMLIGELPESSENFHESVWTLLNLKYRKLVVQNLRINSGLVTVGNDEISKEIDLKFAEDPYVMMRERNIEIHMGHRGSLYDNALHILETNKNVDIKNRDLRRVQFQVNDLAVKKCNAIIQNTENIMKEHVQVRDTHLLSICDNEAECNEKMRKNSLKPLGLTFETFGYDPMRGRLVLGGVASRVEASNDPKAKISWRATTTVHRKPKPQKSIKEIVDTIRNSHPYVLETGIA